MGGRGGKGPHSHGSDNLRVGKQRRSDHSHASDNLRLGGSTSNCLYHVTVVPSHMVVTLRIGGQGGGPQSVTKFEGFIF